MNKSLTNCGLEKVDGVTGHPSTIDGPGECGRGVLGISEEDGGRNDQDVEGAGHTKEANWTVSSVTHWYADLWEWIGECR